MRGGFVSPCCWGVFCVCCAPLHFALVLVVLRARRFLIVFPFVRRLVSAHRWGSWGICVVNLPCLNSVPRIPPVPVKKKETAKLSASSMRIPPHLSMGILEGSSVSGVSSSVSSSMASSNPCCRSRHAPSRSYIRPPPHSAHLIPGVT